MRLIEQYLKTVTAAIASATGVKAKGSPKGTGGASATANLHSQINALPEEMCKPIQDMNPASPTFGKFYFMAGYDDIGGDAPLGG